MWISQLLIAPKSYRDVGDIRIRNAQDDQFEVELNIQLKATLFQLGTKILNKVHHFKSDSSSCYAKFI